MPFNILLNGIFILYDYLFNFIFGDILNIIKIKKYYGKSINRKKLYKIFSKINKKFSLIEIKILSN